MEILKDIEASRMLFADQMVKNYGEDTSNVVFILHILAIGTGCSSAAYRLINSLLNSLIRGRAEIEPEQLKAAFAEWAVMLGVPDEEM